MAKGPTAAGVAQLMGYGMSILGALKAGAKVTDLWNVIYSQGYVGGAGGATIQDLNHVAAKWREVANAGNAFAAAVEQGLPGITSDMVALAPWMQLGDLNPVQPQYQIRYDVTISNEGVDYTLSRSTIWEGSLEGFGTSDVLGMAQDSAAGIASGDAYPDRPADETPAYVGGLAAPIDPSSIYILQVG